MKVLADFHHQALFHSLHMLFEGRLGWELYRPIGEEWWQQGFWKVYNHPNTAKQFLGLHQATDMPHDVHGEPLPEVERKNLHYTVEDGVYYIKDLTYGTTHRGVRLEKFKEMDFDILISSIPQHIDPFNRLIQGFQPGAKHIFQVGNRWTSMPGVQNVMASTAPFNVRGLNAIFYHQEFNLETYKYVPPTFHNVVNSYVHYMKKPQLMQKVISSLPGWVATTYGAGMQLQLQGAQAVADTMRNSAFTWHFKPGGDGFGHVLYGTYACGRPSLVYGQHYRGCGANSLLVDGVTCIDTSIRTGAEIVQALELFSTPEKHAQMCQAAYDRFRQVVNFDAEFEQIKSFLENLR